MDHETIRESYKPHGNVIYEIKYKYPEVVVYEPDSLGELTRCMFKDISYSCINLISYLNQCIDTISIEPHDEKFFTDQLGVFVEDDLVDYVPVGVSPDTFKNDVIHHFNSLKDIVLCYDREYISVTGAG